MACRRCGTFLCRGCAKKLPRGHACAECWPVEVDASGAFVAQRLISRSALSSRASMYVLAAFAGLVLVLLFAAAFTHLFPGPGS